jgi:hypothetical protein
MRTAPIDQTALLLDIVARLKRIEAAIERLGQQHKPLSRADRQTLARILPAVAGVFGSEPFLASEVEEHESPGLQLVRAGMTARSIGRLLRRAVGIPIDGYVVERLSSEAGAVLWSVRRLLEFPGDQNSRVPLAGAGESLSSKT